jgi:NAD(P)-dependent dehydrogenase (short-subunit alcohol dehydrogenase family)
VGKPPPELREHAVTERFDGKTVLVTGAARGIGRATARLFAEHGAVVGLVGRTAEGVARAEAEIVGAGGEAFALVCDVRDGAAVARAVGAALARTGRVDVLVNNAGISGEEAPFLELTEAAWDDMLALNLKGPFLFSQAMARAMAAADGGVILHNASIAGLGVDGAFSHYCAAKAGLLALTRSMAVELAPHRVRVNAVSPGYARTDMTMQYFGPEMEAYLAGGFERVPLRRLVEPEEVARAFLFLASAAASGITGANLVVDGGLTANLYIMETLPKG